MKLLRHVLPSRLRPAVRAAIAATAALTAGWGAWTMTTAMAEHAQRERWEELLRARPFMDQGIEAACSVAHLLAPSQRQQLRELCGRLGPGAVTPR